MLNNSIKKKKKNEKSKYDEVQVQMKTRYGNGDLQRHCYLNSFDYVCSDGMGTFSDERTKRFVQRLSADLKKENRRNEHYQVCLRENYHFLKHSNMLTIFSLLFSNF